MASGVLGRVSLASTTNTVIYTVPAGTTAYVNVNLANRTSASAAVRVAVAVSATPQDSEYIEYDTDISGNGVLERTGLVLGAGYSIITYSDKADVSVMAYGVEQT